MREAVDDMSLWQPLPRAAAAWQQTTQSGEGLDAAVKVSTIVRMTARSTWTLTLWNRQDRGQRRRRF